MRAVKRLPMLVALLAVVAVSGCVQGTVSPSAGEGAPIARWLTIQLREITILADRSDGPDQQAELQVYMLLLDPHDATGAKFTFPDSGSIGVEVGQSIPMSKFGMSVDVNSLGSEVLVYIVAVDIDEQGPAAEMATDIVGQLLVQGSLVFLTKGASVPSQLALETVGGLGIDRLTDWVREADVIGEDVIVLRRSEGWGAGGAVKHLTPDGGLEVVYQVHLEQRPSAEVERYALPASPDSGQTPDYNPEHEPDSDTGSADPSCQGALAPRMEVGERGRVTYGEGPSSLWVAPNKKPEVAKLAEGAEFTVIDGPVCVAGKRGNLNAWKVRLADGTKGWLNEGYAEGPYWIEPLP